MRRLVFVALASYGLSARAEKAPSPAAPTPPAGSTILFDDVFVLDGERSIERADLPARGAEIGVQIARATGARIVACAGETILAGLVDCHPHVRDERP